MDRQPTPRPDLPNQRAVAPRAARGRALIVGGGVAGLASAILLGRSGWRCYILERCPERLRQGHGMLLPPAGRVALEALVGMNGALADLSAPIDAFELCDSAGTLLGNFPIQGSLSLLHRDLLTLLRQSLPVEVTVCTESCLALEPSSEGGNYRVVDTAGRRWEADLIVGADGIGSVCRGSLFPEARLTPGLVTELVMVVKDEALVGRLRRRCRKFQDPSAGLALGLVPCRDNQVVIYAQMATHRHPPPPPAAAHRFLWERFGHWNNELRDLLADLDTCSAHLWHTADLDPLPQLHRRNAVLVGDSAHPMLPFTSQGAAAALQDAMRLCAELAGGNGAASPTILTDALARYSAVRMPELRPLLMEGRALRQSFLEAAPIPGNGVRAPVAGLAPAPLVPG